MTSKVLAAGVELTPSWVHTCSMQVYTMQHRVEWRCGVDKVHVLGSSGSALACENLTLLPGKQFPTPF